MSDPIQDALQATSAEDKTSKNVPWYVPSLGDRLNHTARAFYEAYTNLQGAALEEHLHKIRDQAWSVASYPCLGLWVFLQDPLVKLPTYEKALSCALAGGKVLDLGCCFGQDLRRFAIEGVPTEQMWALDRDKRLWDLGYELFRDRDKMKAHFLEEDAFQLASSSRSTPSAPVQQLPNDFSVILAFHFLHLFKWEDQLRLCEIIATLSKPGTIVLGSQMGSPEPRHLETPWGHMFLQSALTLKEMWRTAGKRTETAWTVSFTREIGIVEWGLRREDCGWIDARNREVDWVVERVR